MAGIDEQIDERARLKMMPVRDLLAEAKARGIPTKGLLEKSEFIEALVAASAPAPAAASSSSSSSGCSAAGLETPTSGTSAQSAFVSPSAPPPHAAMSDRESKPVQIEFEHSWLRALSPNWYLESRQVLTTFGSVSHWQERFEFLKQAFDAMSRPHALNFKGERQYKAFFEDLENYAGSSLNLSIPYAWARAAANLNIITSPTCTLHLDTACTVATAFRLYIITICFPRS